MDFQTILIIAVIILAIMFVFSLVLKGKQNSKQHKSNEEEKDIKDPMPYLLTESIFTKSENSVYKILENISAKNNVKIFAKVRIADIIKIEKQNKNFTYWFNKIKSKHVDFLICQPETFKPLLAVELDDYTHNYKSRKERDDFVDKIYSDVGLPVLHITEINSVKIEQSVAEVLGISVCTIL